MGSKDHSFDIVSKVDLQEVTNAVEQSRKEITTRYDFKDSNTSLQWNKEELTIQIQTESDFRLRSVLDVLHTKCAKRGVPVTSLQREDIQKATGGGVRQIIKIQQGIPIEKAREIVKFLKDSKLKVQSQIQGDEVRVQSSKIDLLQEAVRLLRGQSFGIHLSFINYR